MSSEPRTGRPRASSRETLAEAACELFLEKGYESTSITDITTRAGVSRSSFFNYFGTKADVLWGGLDERIQALATQLRDERMTPVEASVRAAVAAVVDGFAPDSLALALAHADAMGIADELAREAAVRQARISSAVADRLRRAGVPALRADVVAAAYGAAVVAGLSRWAEAGPGRVGLGDLVAEALGAVPAVLADGTVRQLRVVVRADDFPDAVRFYRDGAGMPARAAYSGAGDAQVVILDAGRATLEIVNAAQSAMIDAVETDGDAPSDRIRIALEVADASAVTDRLVDGGAVVQARPRPTPWGSRNSRLRAPAGLQLTLFEEGAAGTPDGEAD
jgi:AcrR family transcriptional regulator